MFTQTPTPQSDDVMSADKSPDIKTCGKIFRSPVRQNANKANKATTQSITPVRPNANTGEINRTRGKTTRFCLEIPMEIGQFETKNKVQDIIASTIKKEVAKVGDILKNILGCSPSVYKTDNKTDDRGPFETITF